MKRGREKAARKMASSDVLKKRARKQAISNLKKKFSKNKRYAELTSGEKEVIDKRIQKLPAARLNSMARKLLPSVKQSERDRKTHKVKKESVDLDLEFENFLNELTEKTGIYYKGVDKNKKDDREAHFKRNAKKDDDDPSAYKPAPGDAEAKTKESKHTKKARAMGYTEELEEDNMWGKRQGKRPHMLLDKNNKVKFDKRFKMYKPDVQESADNSELNDINDLMESTESYIQEDAADKSLAKKAEKSGMAKGILKQVYNRGVAAWKTGHRPGTTPEQWGHARVNSFITKSSGTWGKADKDLAAKVRKEEVELEENYKITKIYNPTTKKSRAAGKSTATFAVHSHDRKYFKEFPTQKDAQNHMKSLGKKEEVNLGESEASEDLATIANKAVKEKEASKRANRFSKKIMHKKKKPEDKDQQGIYVDEEAGAGEEGTNKLTKKFKKDTPNA